MRAGNRFCPLKNPRPGVNTRASGGLRAARDGRRSVAQPGRALASGARGRRFESSHSDHRSPVGQTRKAWVLRPELSDLAKKVPPSLPWPSGNPTALNRCVNAPARPPGWSAYIGQVLQTSSRATDRPCEKAHAGRRKGGCLVSCAVFYGLNGRPQTICQKDLGGRLKAAAPIYKCPGDRQDFSP